MHTSETSATTLSPFAEDTSEGFTVPSVKVTSPTDTAALLSSHPLFRAAEWINKVVLVVILVLGFFGNTMTLVLQRRMGRGSGSAMSVFISSLAVSDSAMLLVLGMSMYFYTFEIFVMDYHDVLCKVIYWLMNVIASTSSWILVAMTLQRAASIVWSHRINRKWTARKAKITVLVIVVMFMIVNCHILYGRRLQSLSSGQTVCLFVSEEYENFFDHVSPVVDIVLCSLVPFVLVISANVVLVKRVRQAMKEARQTLAAGSTDQVKVRQQKTSRMTLTLVCVSVAFLVLTSPICVLYLVRRAFNPAISMDINETAKSYLAEYTLNTLWLANNAINFYIYVMTGSRYRTAMASVCGCDVANRQVTSVTRSTVVTRPSDLSTTHPPKECGQ